MITSPRRWGIVNDYGPLKDVLLGTPAFYRWIDAGPITMRTLNNREHTGVQFDLQTAMSQHAEMVEIYESNGVTCHYLDADEALHRNFFARDSSAMTPWGALICHMQLKSRRADYVTADPLLSEQRHPDLALCGCGSRDGRQWWRPSRGNSCTWTAWWCRLRRTSTARRLRAAIRFYRGRRTRRHCRSLRGRRLGRVR